MNIGLPAKNSFAICTALVGALTLATPWGVPAALGAVITVTSTNDNGPGSLRQAIQDAANGDTINFSVTGVITLTNGELFIMKDLTINGPGASSLAVSGTHYKLFGNYDQTRVFEISSNVTANISGLTIREGSGSLDSADYRRLLGGGIYNRGTLALSACMVTKSYGIYLYDGAGSGIYNAGVLDVNLSIVEGNYNRGIYNDNGANLKLNASTIRGNSGGGVLNRGSVGVAACVISGNYRGGVYNEGILVSRDCSFSGNLGANGEDGSGTDGGNGGAIYNGGTLALTNCTFSGNVAGHGGEGSLFNGGDGGKGGNGGGLYNAGTVTLVACAFSGNYGGAGGAGGNGWGFEGGGAVKGGNGGDGGSGGAIFDATNASYVSLQNTLIAENFAGAGGVGGPGQSSGQDGSAGAGPDLAGPFTSKGHNLIGRTDGSSGFRNGRNADLAGTAGNPIHPMLGPLADNGGPTLTMALLPDSPAIDAGDDALLAPPFNLTTDQRGLPRKYGTHVDIGAFELQPSAIAPSLTAVAMQSNSQFRLTVVGEAGRSYTIQASSNLVSWIAVTNFVSATGTNQFTDPAAPNFGRRFYRAVTP